MIERLWWAPGIRPGSTHYTTLAWYYPCISFKASTVVLCLHRMLSCSSFRPTTSDSVLRSHLSMYHHISCIPLSLLTQLLSSIFHLALIPFLESPWVSHPCENRFYNGSVDSLSFEMICRKKHHSSSPWAAFVLLLSYCSRLTDAPRGSHSPAR